MAHSLSLLKKLNPIIMGTEEMVKKGRKVLTTLSTHFMIAENLKNL